jgi:two-component system LytT family response regulator
MNILIIEDETVAAERLRQMVETNAPDAVVTGICDSIETSVQYLQSNPMPDLMLMDIELVDGQSFEIFKEVKVSCPVIFTTAYDEFVLRAFSVHSIDYLLKPIQVDDLVRAFSKFRELRKVYNPNPVFTAEDILLELRKAVTFEKQPLREHFLVKQGQRLISITVDEIAYFYSEDRITFLKTFEGKFYVVDQPLEELEQQLHPQKFFRASRKYLVSRRSVSNIYVHFNGKLKAMLIPSIEDELLVSRDRAPEFKRWLGG